MVCLRSNLIAIWFIVTPIARFQYDCLSLPLVFFLDSMQRVVRQEQTMKHLKRFTADRTMLPQHRVKHQNFPLINIIEEFSDYRFARNLFLNVRWR